LGNSIGHREGDTLVVDTTNFTDKNRSDGSGEILHVIERFTWTADGNILYKATIDDPATSRARGPSNILSCRSGGDLHEYAATKGTTR
jgi:hypothetical protein